MPHITSVQFTNRFVSLVLSGQGLPNKQLDRHILFISVIMGLESGREYSEKELNEALKMWTTQFGENLCMDHVTLRRFLVDEHYVKRDAAGAAYALATTDLPYTYDREIESLDLGELIREAQTAREERKRLYQRESKPSGKDS